jgi:hypothetical protein
MFYIFPLVNQKQIYWEDVSSVEMAITEANPRILEVSREVQI